MINKDSFNIHSKINFYDFYTHELIYSTHNMIVGTGRSMILKAIFGGNSEDAIDPTKFKIFFDDRDSVTTESFTINTILNNGANHIFLSTDTNATSIGKYMQEDENTYKFVLNNSETEKNQCLTINTTNNEYYITINGIIEKSNSNIIYGLGLIYGTGDTVNSSSYTLFSRAYIDPVYLRKSRKYMVEYIMYF